MFVVPLGSAAANPVAAVVTLTGATIAATGGGYVLAQLWVTISGVTYKYVSPTGTEQINVSTDWIIPNENPDPLYEVRFLNFVKTGPVEQSGGLQGVVDGEWLTVLPLGRGVFTFTADDERPTTFAFDVEMRLDGGAVLATAPYTMSASRI